MDKLTKPMVQDMLRLQDRLNLLVNPRWISANYSWARAVRVECAELTEHLGWKWWKKQEPDFAQAQIEAVDIWHFILSAVLAEEQGQHEAATTTILANLEFPRMEVLNLGGRQFTLNGLTLHDSVDMLAAFAGLGFTFPALFQRVLENLDMTWAQLHRQYVAKNVLNIFRQQHGYKDGTYRKEWFGAEDNVFLERCMNEHPDETAQQLLDRLGFAYAEVKQGVMS